MNDQIRQRTSELKNVQLANQSIRNLKVDSDKLAVVTHQDPSASLQFVVSVTSFIINPFQLFSYTQSYVAIVC
jgi:hypothetical protein